MTDLRTAPVPGLRADDHVRGADDAPLVLFYGDLACSACALAHERLRSAPVRVVFRHFALKAKHPRALALAHAAEAAAAQGAFWEVHDAMLAHQDQLDEPDLVALATSLGLDGDALLEALHSRRFAARVAEDVRAADASGVAGTPTFFINGQRHYGRYDIDSLKAAVAAAHEQALVGKSRRRSS
jgi:protein-disulfide isomerase